MGSWTQRVVIIALIGGIGTFLTIWQKTKADKQKMWWERLVWMIETATTDSDGIDHQTRNYIAWKILPQITGSTLRDRTDKDLAKAFDDFLEEIEIESNQRTEDDHDTKSSNAEDA